MLDDYLVGKITADEVSEKFDLFKKTLSLGNKHDEWVKLFPNSYSARLARGVFHTSNAWNIRGTKFANETTDSQFISFGKELEKAVADLEASIKLFQRPVESYSRLIVVSKGLGLNREREFLDEAIKIDPKAYYPRYNYFDSIKPKWGGSIQKMDAFIQECNASPMEGKNKSRIFTEYYSSIAQQARVEKQYRIAADMYFKAYQNNKEANTLYWSIIALIDGGFYDLAINSLNLLIKENPDYVYGYMKRGYVYEEFLKNDEKAFSDYKAAAELGSGWALNRIGWWYLTGKYVKQDYIQAEVYFRRAIALNDETAKANLQRLEKIKGSNK